MPSINHFLYFLLFFCCACTTETIPESELGQPVTTEIQDDAPVSLIVLGTAQDAGFPQVGCQKNCCRALFEEDATPGQVSCLGLVDRLNDKRYLFDATPDITAQLATLTEHAGVERSKSANGIFLTHAHIGHYTGLMYLGKEVADAKKVPVYTMPRMHEFLKTNGPWDQLVSRENIMIQQLTDNQPVKLSAALTVTPLLVPHRDEYSETVGYRIEGPNKSALFIPDIDKWSKWERNIVEEIRRVDYAFLDATFYSGEELNNRDISQIPHPFIIESLDRFSGLTGEEKKRIIFIHFNHTNPVLNPESEATKRVLEAGFGIARRGEVYAL